MGLFHGIQVMLVVLDPLKIVAFSPFFCHISPPSWVNSQDAVNMLPVSGDMVEVDDALQATRLGEDALTGRC